MKARKSQSRTHGRGVRFYEGARFFHLSDLRTLRRCEKVAAVCFRVRAGIIEFLLVQTRGGRWTFPKGNAEPGLTTAQAAALEAFEEAGVHGRMEEISFVTYVRPKNGVKAGDFELLVTAHLCEVLWLDSPQESGRNPSWFSPERAKRRLREKRSGGYGAELARVVDHATRRIKLLRSRPSVVEISAAIDLQNLRRRKSARPKPYQLLGKSAAGNRQPVRSGQS
jgi:8-oxo-dGTP pyrophosphatase MutT (NUDIX family)